MKLKKILFDVAVFGMLGWSLYSATYLALPPEIQELLPDMNVLTAAITGGSTALFGTGGLAVQTFMSRVKASSDEKYKLLATKYIEMKSDYQNIVDSNEQLTLQLKHNNELLEVDLKAKLSNPLIEQTIREEIEGILNGKQE